jgi:hypothetical protein
MKRILLLALTIAAFPSCAEQTKKPVGPVSDSSRIPWNAPVAGQGGGGQFGMMPQNQHRR